MKRILFVLLLSAWSAMGALSEQEYQKRRADEVLRERQLQEQAAKDAEYEKRKMAERHSSSPVATAIAIGIMIVIGLRFGKMLWDCGEHKK
jgi:hypothetical protein